MWLINRLRIFQILQTDVLFSVTVSTYITKFDFLNLQSKGFPKHLKQWKLPHMGAVWYYGEENQDLLSCFQRQNPNKLCVVVRTNSQVGIKVHTLLGVTLGSNLQLFMTTINSCMAVTLQIRKLIQLFQGKFVQVLEKYTILDDMFVFKSLCYKLLPLDI